MNDGVWEIRRKVTGIVGSGLVRGRPYWDHGGVRVVVDHPKNCLRIRVSLTATVPLYIKRENNRVILTSTLHALEQRVTDLDPIGIYSLLQFGTIVPPFSPWQNVRRIVPGFEYELDLSSGCIVRKNSEVRARLDHASGNPCSPVPIDPAVQVVTCLDEIMKRNCPDGRAIILFSGGVDSGLIAARAAALGWTDAVLVNYALTPNDSETQHAERMARYLGLHYERVMHDAAAATDILSSLEDSCPQPFADHSILPTRCLCRAVIARHGTDRTVFDGTGADGCFGLFGRLRPWKKLYRLPLAGRRLAGWLYQKSDIWGRASSMERYLRLMRRSATMPLLAASIAQNALCGVVYTGGDDAVRDVVHGAIDEWLHEALPGCAPVVMLAATDLAVNCANVFAQKSQPLFGVDTAGLHYPFLDSNMTDLAFMQAVHCRIGAERKAVLKEALSRHVPKEMVYREKCGFAASIGSIFQSPAVLDAFDHLLNGESSLSPYLVPAGMKKLRGMLQHPEFLPGQTANAAWSLVSASLWLEQALDKARSVLDRHY
jgi:asparagine synthase (glutamine-hydrolysing)